MVEGATTRVNSYRFLTNFHLAKRSTKRFQNAEIDNM